jgi:hypothetical protein
MVKKLGISLTLLAGVLLIGAPAVHGLVYDPVAEKALVKFRQDVSKQISKLTQCLGKAAVKCVGNTDPNVVATGVDTVCSVEDPNASEGLAADDKTAFIAAIDKCALKIDLAKKTPEGTTSPIAYSDPNIGMGCPGDPNLADGTPVVDMETYQDSVIEQALMQVTDQAELFPFLCKTGTDPQNCVAVIIKAALAGAKGLFACGLKCETDYKDKKGNGGPNDLLQCCNSSSTDYGSCTPNANYTLCRDKAMDKGAATAAKDADAASIWPLITTTLEQKVDNATLQLFDDTPSCP